MNTSFLARAPFNLDAPTIAWVETTYRALSLQDKVGQLFNLLSRGTDPDELARLERLRPGGITRYFGSDGDAERMRIAAAQRSAPVPLLVSADLEGSRMSLPFGTQVPNPLALAAIDDIEVTAEISRIIADEAVAVGVNWSFTPVIDINHAFRSPIVATRSFGSDVDAIRRHALTQIEVLQRHGVAATAKHWPGEGYDDRDQHLVTTINPLSMAEWEMTFGKLYRAAIDAGVLSIMSAHIALPAFVRERLSDPGIEAFRPASISKLLNIDLLRRELGFNGLIVSDASEMAGLTSWSRMRAAKSQLIAGGCDMILFTRAPEEDMAEVRAAVEAGQLAAERFEDAVLRVLALKAALGLHKASEHLPTGAIARASDKTIADAALRRAPTLVKDTLGLLPISPSRYRRILVISGGIISPLHGTPSEFRLPDMLAGEGFEVTLHTQQPAIDPADFDLVLYLLGEETLLTRGRVFLDWARLGGDFVGAMRRYWHDIPTVMISFGYPYHLYDAPRVPVYINAYCTIDDMQAAVVDLLIGRHPWNRHSPVDPTCGVEDAKY
ncbi:glycoside hydrolase family 3 protein [Bradyrhizobium manausense]|uniref:glycoside hydrolase family 3 protein n=1 Tax=Bradyrhizobium TaxID=374 RepID=UPI001BABB6F3|nr:MULTISPECIES: glycoside hydrolase family 3 protein [Bradyrhizobium]MBR0829920.1 glycoside hydrolase family 3 protein [Bradyrhizobium manausense]UVO27662.1 glycoside hydrolase family 3 protein [Bradyrhizobium arachidis]